MVIKEIFQLYNIGKELGLNRKEINSILIYKKRYPLILALIIIIIITILSIIFWNIALSLYAASSEPVYPSGSFYSTVSIDDFKNKK